MKHIRPLFFLLCLTTGFFSMTNAQNATATTELSKFSWLMGDWVGEGSGQPGQGEGSFSFKTDLDNHIIIRKNHTSYPATTGKPAFVHDDMLIIFSDEPGSFSKAIYMDNEDHVLHYSIQFSADQKTIVFLSEARANMPVFRLSYALADADNVLIKFEIARPDQPGSFNTYLSGKAHKAK